ncbi:hypothetical protein CGZ93_17935 [Enemella dayhoffiae]|uniref:Uncharacterized protein n=1 Tax=Enemella dayhoffiae TaxID=2016507 RepID=A0A255GM49_9ACTN|nr:hypothetical protein [Enemella dayhoffiae]OYO16641.1 hypothetical protein CGZ93_17935 [Enemella dayhoffiae]
MGQFGLDDALSPTVPEDMQRVIQAMYPTASTGPIMIGGGVAGRSDMAYGYTAGAGIVGTAHGGVIVTWLAGQTAPVPQPATSRLDIVYVGLDGAVRVAAGTAPPAGSCVLDKMRLQAGSTSTASATREWDKNYAMPYGGSEGYLDMDIHPLTNAPVSRTWHTFSTLDFTVRTDRHIDVIARQAVTSYPPASLPDSDMRKLGPGSMLYAFNLDGVLMESMEVPFDRRWTAHYAGCRAWKVQAGTHQIRIDRMCTWGADPVRFGGGVDKFVGEMAAVLDVGVAE